MDQIWKAAERGTEGAARPRGAAGGQDGARSGQGFGHGRASASGGHRGTHHIAGAGQGRPALPVDPDVQILSVGQLAKPGHVTPIKEGCSWPGLGDTFWGISGLPLVP